MAPRAQRTERRTQERPAVQCMARRSHGVLSPARRPFPRTGGVSDASCFDRRLRTAERRPSDLDVRCAGLDEVRGSLGDDHDVAPYADTLVAVVDRADDQGRAADLDAL